MLTKHIIYLLVLLLSLVSLKQAGASSFKAQIETLLPKIDQFITVNLEKTKVPGCIISIVGPHDVYFLKAYGVKDLSKKDRLTTKTVFQFGSISKTITATLVAKLHNKEKLSLDKCITSYLPDFRLKDSYHPLLLRHLLSHTSGFSSQGANALIESGLSHLILFNKILNNKVIAKPGERFDYNNIMFGLIEDILVAATGQEFEALLHDNLFKPLGMGDTSVGYKGFISAQDRAYPHIQGKNKSFNPCKRYSQRYYNVSASAGINGSMLDLIPFLQAHLGAYPNILSLAELKLLHTPQIKSDKDTKMLKKHYKYIADCGYALGWRWMNYANERVIYHGGWLLGFTLMVAFLPKYKVAIAVVCNAETSLPFKVTMKFFEFFLSLTLKNNPN